MNTDLIEQIKEKLIEKKRQILETIEKDEIEEIADVESENVIGDIIDAANSVYEMQIFKSLSEKELKALSEIEEALKRIEEGVYGRCVSCGKEIEEKRLLAIPEAKKCIKCKSIEEKRKLQMDS